ncbi:MAG: carbohydrate ABC transporter permease [Lachnospiraceae bacterium]|jgi:multiple sugar transport system permease protein|nr:carbohydrate ABC transporter permease [Lachnospiraceae bacterium]MDD5849639.1 carbohydrate ABC transporter permease [Bacillota bacterium]
MSEKVIVNTKKISGKKLVLRIIVVAILLIFAFLLLTPLIWMMLGAFKSDAEVLSYPPKFFPVANHFADNWKHVQSTIDMWKLILNTSIYAIGTTIPAMFVNSLAAYAFARFNFRGKNVIFILFLATMMIPFQVIMVPLYLEVYSLHWLNTYWGLIIPKIASAYWIFLCRANFEQLPKDLEEAARIDGMGEFGIYLHIMIPLIKPAMVTVFLLSINNCWNDLLWPLIVASKTNMRTLSNGLAMFIGDRTDDYSLAFTAAAVSMIPMLILYLFFQKYFVAGQATSGIKG